METLGEYLKVNDRGARGRRHGMDSREAPRLTGATSIVAEQPQDAERGSLLVRLLLTALWATLHCEEPQPSRPLGPVT